MEIKKIEKSDFVMFPRMQHRGLQFRHVERDAYRASCAMWKGMVTTGSCTNSQNRTLWPTSSYPRRRLSLTTSLASAWGKTIGVNTSRVTSPSFASLQASTLKN